MKDEISHLSIKKPKMYTSITKDNQESTKIKSVNKNVVDNELKYEDCKNVLFNWLYMRYEINRIQSKNHNLWNE